MVKGVMVCAETATGSVLWKRCRPATLLKRDSNTGALLWNCAKFLRTPILNICERLLLFVGNVAAPDDGNVELSVASGVMGGVNM